MKWKNFHITSLSSGMDIEKARAECITDANLLRKNFGKRVELTCVGPSKEWKISGTLRDVNEYSSVVVEVDGNRFLRIRFIGFNFAIKRISEPESGSALFYNKNIDMIHKKPDGTYDLPLTMLDITTFRSMLFGTNGLNRTNESLRFRLQRKDNPDKRVGKEKPRVKE